MFSARFVLEQCIEWLYGHDCFGYPYGSLMDKIKSDAFRRIFTSLAREDETDCPKGNKAAHDAYPPSQTESYQVLVDLHHVLYKVAQLYSDDNTTPLNIPFSAKTSPNFQTPTSPKSSWQLQKNRPACRRVGCGKQQVQALKEELDAPEKNSNNQEDIKRHWLRTWNKCPVAKRTGRKAALIAKLQAN